MRKITLSALLAIASFSLYAQSNIYKIKAAMLQDGAIKNKNETREIEHGEDDNMAKFSRWFSFMEPRCYPSGDVPSPDALLNEWKPENNNRTAGYKKTGSTPDWQPIGPMVPGTYASGIGRVNCIAVNPTDTNTIYIGTANGGLFISHNGGKNWKSNSDNFPSLSVAAIAINPNHPDTIYAATGDEYGYESYSYYNVFWGGLYSAGIVMSSDGGKSWHTTGMSYLQSDRQMVQALLVHPNHPNILLAGTRNGIYRSTDAGATWKNADTNQHVYSMAFKPNEPDTIYAANDSNLKVSYDAGISWQNIYYGINSLGYDPTENRTTIAVSPAAPNDIWAIDNNSDLKVSRNGGLSFTTLTSPAPHATFYGYYDRVLAISPTDSNYVLAGGLQIAVSKDGGISWQPLDTPMAIHPDNHAFAFNPLNTATFYSGNDGGIFVTHDGGNNWTSLNDSLMISQIYRTTSSRQSPYIILCGLQDNSTYRFDGSGWTDNIGGDGEACAISPEDDNIQIGSYQYGNFYLSYDQGNTFNQLYIGSGIGSWTAPVVFSPNSADTIYFGLNDVYATYDGGYTFTSLGSGMPLFPGSIISLAVAPSNAQVLYAADYGHIMRSDDGGTTWNNVSGHLTTDSLAITRIAVDYNDAMRVYVTTSGYAAGKKVYVSTTGGSSWFNMSYNLPNVPANCIAVDSSVIGGVYVGTDMGLYYTDSSMTNWISYGKGLPNVIVDDLDINYTVRKIRAATYGRGLWEADLQARNARGPIAVPKIVLEKMVKVYPNPTEDNWQLIFKNGMPKDYHVLVHDMAGKTVYEGENISVIRASNLKAGNYIIDVTIGGNDYNIKASHK